MPKVILGVAVVLILGFSVFWWMNSDNDGNNRQAAFPPPPSGREIVIAMNKDGFSPDKITVKKGDSVKFVNEDTQDHWPASNIHPTHDIYPEFDPKAPVKPGQSWSFTFGKEGIWRYHDHLHPSLIGTVVAE